MPSIIKVDQIQSDLGTVNVSSNLQFSSGFTMLSPSLSSPTLTTPTTSGVMTLGAGIKFPATQSASSDGNTLDDYEEGTWTAGATIGSGSVTVASTAVCRYTKIGNLVHLCGRPNLNGSGSGALRITGIPFPAAAAPASGSGDQILLVTLFQATGNINTFIGYLSSSATSIIVYYSASTSYSDTAGAYLDSDVDLEISCTYLTST